MRRPGVHEPCPSPSQRDCQGEETSQCEVFGVPRALGSALSGQAPGGRPCAGPSPQVAGAPAGHPTGSSTLRALGRRAADAPAAAGPLGHGVLAAMARGPALVGGSRGGCFSPKLPGAVPEIVPHASRQRGPGPMKRPPSALQGEAVPALSLQAVGGEPGIALAPRASRSGARRPTGSHPSSALMGRAGACDRTCPRRGDVPQSWPARLPAV